MQFPPIIRPRRLRSAAWLRALVSEHRLSPADLIWPVFVTEEATHPAPGMPGVRRYGVGDLVAQAKFAHALGLPALALFPVMPDAKKDSRGSYALDANNVLLKAVAEMKAAVPELGVVCDVALDPYTDHGHDGLIDDKGDVVNDATVDILAQQAVLLAKAGCDIVAPSDMMDGRVREIRYALDTEGFTQTCILSYAVKYASAFYGPFREAVGSAGALKRGSKAGYQMQPTNIKEALREVRLDVEEGADMVVVKPGMPYLDVISRVSQEVEVPVLAYQVSGEYAMLKLAAEHGALDAQQAMWEAMIAFKRAGASAILTYDACDIAETISA